MYAAGGVGIQPDYQEAAIWYRRAAETYGVSTGIALCELAYLYENGKGVQRSYPSAYLLYDLAARYNCPVAEGQLKSLATRMTSAQVAKASSVAATWKMGSPLP